MMGNEGKGRVLIVDDEVHIAENLLQVIPWDALELQVIGTAKNGREALQLLERHAVDLVLCDIRMPVMDGLELVRRLREDRHDCDIIMLSGYGDFEYTRAAIQYGVKDYILKPIPYDELTDVIRRTVADRKERQRRNREQRLRFGKMMDLVGEKVWYDILMDYADVSPNSLVLAGIEHGLTDKRYALMVLDADTYSHRSRHWSDKQRKLWNYAVHKAITETLQPLPLTHAVVQTRDGEWCVLIQGEPDEQALRDLVRVTADDWAVRVRQAAAIVKTELNVGVCGEPLSIAELSDAYRAVRKGMHLHQGGQAVAVFSPDRPRDGESMEEMLWDAVERLVSAWRKGHPGEAEAALSQLSGRMAHLRDAPLHRVQHVINYCALHLLREMKQMGLTSPEQENRLWNSIEYGLTFKEWLGFIREWMDGMKAGAERKRNGESLMAEAGRYIDRNLSRDLGVDEVAAHLGISASYFSMLFKQAYGETFLEYVTRKRMDKAKALLAFTSKSVAHIARELGYSDRRYFTKVFLKYTGQKPLEFRGGARSTDSPERPGRSGG